MTKVFIRYSHLWKKATCISIHNGWVHQPLIPECLIIEFTITQNARHGKCFHDVLCLSEAKGMDIKMIIADDGFFLELVLLKQLQLKMAFLYFCRITMIGF